MTSALEFTNLAKSLMAEAARRGLVVPAFRSHPAQGDRSIRRPGPVVCIRFQGRDLHDVAGDMVDGVVAAQGELDEETRGMVRAQMWEAAGMAVAA